MLVWKRNGLTLAFSCCLSDLSWVCYHLRVCVTQTEWMWTAQTYCASYLCSGASCHSNGLVAPLMFLLSSSAGSAHLTHRISSQIYLWVCVCVLRSSLCLHFAAVRRCVGWQHREISVCVWSYACARACLTVSQRYTLLIWQPTAQPITCLLFSAYQLVRLP